MELFYYRSPDGNFGDDLNPWLWNKVAPKLMAAGQETDLLIGVGTLLGVSLPATAKRKFVIGTGTGLKSPLPTDDSWHTLALRGPLTARMMKASRDIPLGDGALLLRTMDEFRAPPVKRSGVVFMPHISAARIGRWADVCARAGIEYLDPRAPFQDTLHRINGASLMLADAMHGAIVADTLRVPWIPLASSCEINSFKWLDWALSVKAPYRPIRLRHSSVPEMLRDRYWPLTGWDHLVPDTLLDRAGSDPAAADAIFSAFVRRNAHGRVRARAHRLAQGFWHRAILPNMKTITHGIAKQAVARREERMIDRAAEQLSAIARQEGVLSETAALDRTVDGLRGAIDRAVELASA